MQICIDWLILAYRQMFNAAQVTMDDWFSGVNQLFNFFSIFTFEKTSFGRNDNLQELPSLVFYPNRLKKIRLA